MIFYHCSDYYNYACEFILFFLDSIIIYNKCIDDPKILLDIVKYLMIHETEFVMKTYIHVH